MAKYAVISDIHANKEALDLVLKDAEKRGCDKIICLGDLVVRYYYPDYVIDRIRNEASVVIKGNCDNIVATNEAYKWARGRIGLDRIEYLDNLPLHDQLNINKTMLNLYHSSPESFESMFNPLFVGNNPQKYKNMYIPNEQYGRMFTGEEPQITVVGHTHQDYVGIENGGKLDIVDASKRIVIPDDKRAIINVGSAGEHNMMVPNGDNYKAMINNYLTYLIIDDKDLEKGVATQIVKVPYTEVLKKVYISMITDEVKKIAPFSPMDTKNVKNSLEMAGVDTKQVENSLLYPNGTEKDQRTDLFYNSIGIGDGTDKTIEEYKAEFKELPEDPGTPIRR